MKSCKTNPNPPAFFEELESRQLFAAGGPTSAPPITTPILRAKLVLQGTTTRDNMAVDVKKGYLHFFLNGVTKRYNVARVGGIQIYGLNGNDTIKVGDGAPGVFIDGGGHNDTIVGGLGNDTLVGGVGNDKISGRDGEDQIDGGKGRDDINGGAGRDKISSSDLEVDVVDGGDDFDTATLDLNDLFSAVERRLY